MGNSSSSIKKRLEGKPVVVVVGGGPGGLMVAQELDSHFNVLLIDRKNYFFHNIGALRSAVQPSFISRVAIPYTEALKYGFVVQAEAEQITDKGIKLKGRDELVHFDYLVIATGSSYAFPSKVALTDREGVPALYQDLAKQIEKAESILIVGTGPVGVELVGEIKDKYPDKKITLIGSAPKLQIGNTTEEFNKEVEKRLSDFTNFKLVLGERVLTQDIPEITALRYAVGKREVKTDKGNSYQTDLLLFCGGAKVNNNSYKTFFANQMDDHGRLKVNKYLQVEGFQNIFAVGDCNNTPETKMSVNAAAQAPKIVENIKALNHKESLKEYVPNYPMMALTLGAKRGVVQLPTSGGMLVGDTITSFIKGGDLFTGRYLKILNYKPESQSHHETESLKRGISARALKKEELSRMSSFMGIKDQEAKKLVEGLIDYQVDPTAEHT